MAKFVVTYETTLCTSRIIKANNEQDALRIANELKYDESFADDIIYSFENDYDAYKPKYFTVNVDGVAYDDEPADNEE